jgi:Resolvase, N terminal domain
VTDRPPIFQSAGSRHWSRVREQCPQQPDPRAAIEARRAGLEIVQWFRDPAVSGANPEASGVRTVLSLWRTQAAFARDLVAEELGVLLLIKWDLRVLTASGDDLTDTSDPSRVMMRQIAGSFAQYEKARLVTKLRGAALPDFAINRREAPI